MSSTHIGLKTDDVQSVSVLLSVLFCVPNGDQTDECGQTTLSRFIFHTGSVLLWLPVLQDLRSICTHLCKTCRCDLPVIFECPFPHLLLMLQLAPSSSLNSSKPTVNKRGWWVFLNAKWKRAVILLSTLCYALQPCNPQVCPALL